MNVTKRTIEGTTEVPSAGGNITVEIVVTNDAKGTPQQADMTFKRITNEPYETQYIGSATADTKGAVDFHLNDHAQLTDGVKSSLFTLVLKEAAEAFNPEAAEAAE